MKSRKSSLVLCSTVAVLIAAASIIVVLNRWSASKDVARPEARFESYVFSDVVALPVTSVKVQGVSGTCWSFAGISFLESELIRQTGREYDLSEMFAVRSAYYEKGRNYILRQGTARFTEGGLIHDALISAAKHGLVTEDDYPGLVGEQTRHDHREFFSALDAIANAHADRSHQHKTDWRTEFGEVCDRYLGKLPEPRPTAGTGLLERSQLRIEDYVSITSFTHAPFYSAFVLEIPANFASERFHNLPLDEFMSNIRGALERGFTLALDCDCSERFFGNGAAVLPVEGVTLAEVEAGEFKEVVPTQEARQAQFESFATMDDHLMHIVGMATDQFGRHYYKTKNCWGTEWGRNGFTYLSDAYLAMKAISVTLHQDGLTTATRTALGR